jgi:adenylate cyclase
MSEDLDVYLLVFIDNVDHYIEVLESLRTIDFISREYYIKVINVHCHINFAEIN